MTASTFSAAVIVSDTMRGVDGVASTAGVPRDSRGRWEGDTLVVETTNFSTKTAFRGASDKLRLIERFMRVAPDSLLYEFTVTDPATWTKPWTVQIPMTRSAERLYEYACHEGNYSIANALEGSRIQERNAKALK